MQLDSIYFAPVEWSGTMPMMNWASTGRQVRWILRDPDTGRENMDIDWRFPRGGPGQPRRGNAGMRFPRVQDSNFFDGQRFLVPGPDGRSEHDLARQGSAAV